MNEKRMFIEMLRLTLFEIINRTKYVYQERYNLLNYAYLTEIGSY